MPSIFYIVIQNFKAKWELRYPGRKFFPQKYHYKQLKNLMEPVEGFTPMPYDEIIARMPAYFNNPWYERCAHNFSSFIKNIDTFIPARKVEPAPARKLLYCSKCNFRHYEGTPCRCEKRSTEPAPIPMVHDIIEQIKKDNRGTILKGD